MAFDFKKEYKELYMPSTKPAIVTVPEANYIAISGKGDPNVEGGEYKQAIGKLFSMAYAIRMSHKGNCRIDGFYEFVVPPLEGFWWQEDADDVDYADKSAFNWISVIRMPGFVTKDVLQWAIQEVSRKKKMDGTNAEFLTVEEGICVQVMHVGSFDSEPDSIVRMDQYAKDNGYMIDINSMRLHHEIYLSDVTKVPVEKWKTVIRHPIKPADFNQPTGLNR